MEGSPVRGQEKAAIVRLNESADLQSFQAEIIRTVAADVRHAEILFSVFDEESKSFALPSWIQSYVERHSALQTKLEQGELVGISYAEGTRVPRPVGAARSSVVLIPVISDSLLQAVIGLVSQLDDPQPAAEDIERVRQLAYDAGPIVCRLREGAKLRRENEQLAAVAARAARAEEAVGKLVEEKNAFELILQMRAHLNANIAHDLRTPLAAIRGYARMMLDGRGGTINDTQRDYLRVVTENTNRLIHAVTWMSHMSEYVKQAFPLVSFDLREAWTECVEALQPVLREKALKLDEKIPNEDFAIIGDREKLTSVMSELVKVTSKVSGFGGTIVAEFSHGREREVSVKISNSAASIPPDVLGRIFERSFAGPAPIPQSTDAAAINLSGIYDIVGMHGGRIFVNSTPTQGATFLFTLPAVSVGGEEDNHEQAVNSGSRRR